MRMLSNDQITAYVWIFLLSVVVAFAIRRGKKQQ